MANDIDVALERIRQQRDRDRAGVDKPRALNTTPEERMGTRWKPGDRVIDLVTGEEAIVEGSTRQTVIVPTADK